MATGGNLYRLVPRSTAKLHYNSATGDIISYREYRKYQKDNTYNPRVLISGTNKDRYVSVKGSKGAKWIDSITGLKISKYKKIKWSEGISPTEKAKRNKLSGNNAEFYNKSYAIDALWREFVHYKNSNGEYGYDILRPDRKNKEFKKLLDKFNNPILRHYIVDEYELPANWEYYGPGDTPD